MKKKLGIGCKAWLVLFMLFATIFMCSGQAESAQKVKVGYFDLGQYYSVDANGVLNSYDCAFLNETAKYTGFQYEYVDCGTWSNAIRMLEAHKIDLVGTMQWTAEREEQYEICDASYGYSVAELAALSQSDYIYEDYKAMDGSTVGCVDGYVILNQLKSFMKRENVTLTIKTYENQKKLDKALENGEVDLIAANAHAMHEDWKVIEKFAYAPFYFASWKGNAKVTEAISAAIIQIHVYQSEFADNLIRDYFPQLVNSPFTKEEVDLVAKRKEYTIYFDGTTAPLVWYDEESNQMVGVLVDIMEQLQEQTGLKINIKRRTKDVDQTAEDTISYRTLYYGSKQDASKEEGVTNSILDQDFEMYHRVGEEFVQDGKYKIAIVVNRDGLQDYLSNSYPDCSLVEYNSPSECMDALDTGKVDLAFLNCNIADNLRITHNLEQITAVPMTSSTFGIAIQFHGENDQMLSEIIDKGLQMVDEGKINAALVKYALNTAPEETFSSMVKKHIGLTVGLCIGFVILIIAFAISLTYVKVMRRQNVRIEAANQARTDFFARMSHDMRTPMNGILGMAKLSKQEKNIEALHTNIEKIEDAGEYMLSLINDTLDLQRLESGKMKFNLQVVEAISFFHSVLDMAETSAKQKSLSFQVDLSQVPEEDYLRMDPIRVKQVMMNLTSNAIKFTPSGGEVRVVIQRMSKENEKEQYQIVVQDTGVGMSDQFMSDNLFHAYAQEHNKVSDQYAGSGLGLAISKNIVELMDGHIEVESELGEGTKFVVSMAWEQVNSQDVAKKMQSKEELALQIKEGLQGKHILLAEDHPLNAEIVIRLLQKVGCEVTWAENGLEAVRTFEESEAGTFQGVLMDIRMPKMDGLEAAECIRKQRREDAKTIPIIALSANAYDDDVKACLDVGMNAHLAKPINPDNLYATLAEIMK